MIRELKGRCLPKLLYLLGYLARRVRDIMDVDSYGCRAIHYKEHFSQVRTLLKHYSHLNA